MLIEKTFSVAAPRQRVWDFITSPQDVAPCIPGCENAEEINPGNYEASIVTKIGPIKVQFKVDIKRQEERCPEYACYETSGAEGNRASRIKATSTLALKELQNDMTEVSYRSEINIVGRLGKFGKGMMQKVADSVGNEFVENIRAEIEENPA